jgi:transcriptional regulator with XRE-family HTH domain
MKGKREMLGMILRSELKKRELSPRNAAKMIGISHTTIIRIMKGEQVDLSTLIGICNWLGINPSTILSSIGTGQSAVAASVAALIELNPLLTEVFTDAVNHFLNGDIEPNVIQDIFVYSSYRINSFLKNKENVNKSGHVDPT